MPEQKAGERPAGYFIAIRRRRPVTKEHEARSVCQDFNSSMIFAHASKNGGSKYPGVSLKSVDPYGGSCPSDPRQTAKMTAIEALEADLE
jgi:hypothetical protein